MIFRYYNQFRFANAAHFRKAVEVGIYLTFQPFLKSGEITFLIFLELENIGTLHQKLTF